MNEVFKGVQKAVKTRKVDERWKIRYESEKKEKEKKTEEVDSG